MIDKIKEFNVPKWLIAVLCLMPWLLGAGVFIWILFLRFPLDGMFKIEADLTGGNAYVFPFLPAERTILLDGRAEGWKGQRIVDDPVYMNIVTPGPYESVEVAMDFKVLRQPLLEFGLVKDSAGQQLEMYPWYSEVLELESWKAVVMEGKTKGYVARGMADDRLLSRDTRGLAVWLASTTSPVMSDSWSDQRLVKNVSLRGAHDFWVVPADGKIFFKIIIQDVNRNRSGGVVAVQVLLNDVLVHQDAIGTSGSRDVGYGALTPVTVDLKDLAPGVYRLKVVADDDIFIRRVETHNPRWVVGPRLVIGDVVGYATTTHSLDAWTNARHIVAETFHKEGFQEISLGSVSGIIRRTHTPVRIDRTDETVEPVRISAPNGDVRVIADGYFSFDQSSFFEPQPRRLTAATMGSREGIEAVLTGYQRVEALGDGWMRAKKTFPIVSEAGSLRLVLSAPGIASRAGAVDIKKVSVTFRRAPMDLQSWWDLLLKEAKIAWRRIR